MVVSFESFLYIFSIANINIAVIIYDDVGKIHSDPGGVRTRDR